MNRFLSVLVFVAVGVAALAVGGFFNAAGHVAIGDTRVPARFVAGVAIMAIVFGAGAFGQNIPWASWLAKLKGVISASPGASTPSPANTPDRTSERLAVAVIPVHVEHLLGCVHHLRSALKSDEEGQKLLDSIAIKVGRVVVGSNVDPEQTV